MWHQLYLPLDDSGAVAATLRARMEAHEYQSYDPFPGGTGTPSGMAQMVRLFVAPAQDGWVCVLGQPDDTLLPDLSTHAGVPVLYGWLTEEDGGFALFRDGVRRDDPAVLEPYLRTGQTLDMLRRAFEGKLAVPPVEGGRDQPPVIVAGADSLPPEIQQLAQEQGVDPKKANSILKRLSNSLFGRLARLAGDDSPDTEQAQAREVFMGGGRDLWNSLHGQRVRAAAGVLRLPTNWREPAWETVRDAYQVHRLRQRSPRMALMPGDREMMDAVPDALAYTPVYMGRT